MGDSSQSRDSTKRILFYEIPCLRDTAIVGLVGGTAGWFARTMGGHRMPIKAFILSGLVVSCLYYPSCRYKLETQREFYSQLYKQKESEKLLRQIHQETLDINQEMDSLDIDDEDVDD